MVTNTMKPTQEQRDAANRLLREVEAAETAAHSIVWQAYQAASAAYFGKRDELKVSITNGPTKEQKQILRPLAAASNVLAKILGQPEGTNAAQTLNAEIERLIASGW